MCLCTFSCQLFTPDWYGLARGLPVEALKAHSNSPRCTAGRIASTCLHIRTYVQAHRMSACCGTTAVHLVTCVLGLMLSVYALHVETTMEKDVTYTPMCDISPGVSCSANFMSKYGKGFGVVNKVVGDKSSLYQPNSLYGIIFYCVLAATGPLPWLWVARLRFAMTVASNLMSLYLGYIQYFIIQSMCVVCIATYLVNFVLLVCAWKQIRMLRSAQYHYGDDFTYVLDGKKRV